MDYKISIIMPVYNAEKWISRTIESIINQTYSNFEYIIILDNCSDKTFDICQRYENDKRIVLVINEKNIGVASSTNKGLDCFTGDIVMFMDHDDYYLQNALQLVADNWDEGSQFLLFGAYEKKDGFDYCWKFQPAVGGADHYYNILINQRNFSILPTNWAKAYSAKIINSNHIRFIDGFNYAQDFIFNCRYLQFCSLLRFFSELIYVWDRDVNQIPQSNFYDYDKADKDAFKYSQLLKVVPSFVVDYLTKNYVTNCYNALKQDACHKEFVSNKELKERVKNYRMNIWDKYKGDSFIKSKLVVFCLNKKMDYLLYCLLRLYRIKGSN